MKIETLDDWNLADCCCPMPACPTPDKECESIDGRGEVGYVIYNTSTKTYYGTKRTDYADGGFTQQKSTSNHWTWLGDQWIEPPVTESTDGEPKTGTKETTYTDIVDVEASRAASYAAMADGLDWENMTKGASCQSSRSEPSPYGWFQAIHLNATFVRFRWVIPDTFAGKHFKITWDVVEEPDGWDDADPTVSRSFFARDQTWEWTGPGNSSDPDSWKSDWYEIPAPSVPGSRRVVNLRYECYRSTKFGTKPQVDGDAVEI